MGWSTDEEFIALVHDKDLTIEGLAHQYGSYRAQLSETNGSEEAVLLGKFLRILWTEYPEPSELLIEASPAMVFEALYAMTRLDDLKQKPQNDELKKLNKLIELLKQQNKTFLKDYKTDTDAVNNYKAFDDDSWVLFEYLSILIKRNPQCTNEDHVFADRLMNIYNAVRADRQKSVASAPQEEQRLVVIAKPPANTAQPIETPSTIVADSIEDNKNSSNNTPPAENNNTQNNHHKHKPKKKNKHTHKESSSRNEKPKEQANVLLQEIHKLKPTQDTLIGDAWDKFFLVLSEALKQYLPYKNNDLQSNVLLMHERNEAEFKRIILEAIKFTQLNDLTAFPDKQLLLVIIGKFNDRCIQLKHDTVAISLATIQKYFEDPSPVIWKNRASSQTTKDHIFNKNFPNTAIQQLTLKDRYDLRMKFVNAVKHLPAMPGRSELITYCANKLGPEDDPRPATQLEPQRASASFHVPPGSENKPWGKFIENVYKVFEKDNPLWNEDGSDTEIVQKLQPILEQFKKDFPTEAERAQAQRHFISFIPSNDCKFAKGADRFAWLFLEEMIPQSTASLLSQREAIRNLKKEINQTNTQYQQAESLLKSLFTYQK